MRSCPRGFSAIDRSRLRARATASSSSNGFVEQQRLPAYRSTAQPQNSTIAEQKKPWLTGCVHWHRCAQRSGAGVLAETMRFSRLRMTNSARGRPSFPLMSAVVHTAAPCTDHPRSCLLCSACALQRPCSAAIGWKPLRVSPRRVTFPMSGATVRVTPIAIVILFLSLDGPVNKRQRTTSSVQRHSQPKSEQRC